MGRHTRFRRTALAVVAPLVWTAVRCGGGSPAAPSPATAPPAVFVGAGDIADCGPGAASTARLLDALGGTIFTAGDNAYGAGTEAEFATCFAPTWGRHLARIRPSPGNHDYATAGAAGYFGYFGERAGPSGRGYYSFDLGAWHIVSLNSNVSVAAGSEEDRWLAADLAAARQRCVLAFWHHPRFSSALHGSDASLTDLWRTLYDARADLVVNGHDHTYERFAPQTPSGAADSIRGIREFVVGTGGAPLYPFVQIAPNSEVRYNAGWGVLKLSLDETGYAWTFIPADGAAFADSGTGRCVP
jgi:Calcineurin-like phosphoesterase